MCSLDDPLPVLVLKIFAIERADLGFRKGGFQNVCKEFFLSATLITRHTH